jgi:hypothetical protein
MRERLAMRTERENLVFRVSMAVSEGIGSMRGVRQLNEEQRKRVAETIVHELETTNWQIRLRAPARPPG